MLQNDTEQLVKRIGIADGALAERPSRLRTSGLGSCIGLVLFDVQSGFAGMVHVMLPVAPTEQKETLVKVQKYADTGVQWLVQEMRSRGAVVSRLRAKMAGGAQMFTFVGKSDILRVGPRNVEAVHSELQRIGIPVVAEDVGGKEGRTIEFDTDSQLLFIRTARAGTLSI